MPDPSATAVTADAVELIRGLERLRGALLRRLDRLEAAAAADSSRASDPPRGPDPAAVARDRDLRERAAALVAAEARAADRQRDRDREWDEQLDRLDADRRLLAEAWERLERREVEAPAHARAHAHAHHPGTDPEPPKARPPSPAPVPAGDPGADDPVALAILRQFQALKSDVRRNAR